MAYHAYIVAIEQNFRQLDLRTGKVTASNQAMISHVWLWSFTTQLRLPAPYLTWSANAIRVGAENVLT